MRVYLSVDMEGVAGISDTRPTRRGDDRYGAAVALMDGEANAAIQGAYDGGASVVVVNDSHGSMDNLTPEAIDSRARLVQGRKPLSMVEAARDASFGVALFVGYHARAGHPRGVIAHTYSGKPTLVTLNGRPTPEAAINALYLGALGIPVGLVTGDDALAEEVEDWLPWAERVVVKRAVSWEAADSVHPSRARELIRVGAKRAVERAIRPEGGLEPLRLEPPIELVIEFASPVHADLVAVIPGVDRTGDRGVRYASSDPTETYRAFLSAIRIAGTADS